MLKEDYHIHCENSPDSSEPLDAMCRAAAAKGITEIMVTDHYELFTNGSGMENFRAEYLEQCVHTVNVCREKYGESLYVGLGIELGQWHLQPETASQVLCSYPFDYVIASLHKLDDVDLGKWRYEEIDCAALRHRYLEELLLIVQTADFDCLGHLDLVKRYAAARQVSIRAEEEEELVREILRTLVKRDKGVEINTSGLRQAVGETFPSREILKWYRQEGGCVITVGSDAHRMLDVGEGFDQAEMLIRELGFERVSRFRKRERLT